LPNKLKVMAAALALAATVQPAAAQAPNAQAEEIVVTAQRTGVPVWRVNSPTTTLVLIGSIDGVAKDTKWDPAALTETLRKADRVMFPSMMQVAVSPFSMVGYYMKFRKQGTLPKGQTLQTMLAPAQYERLAALQKRGVLKAGRAPAPSSARPFPNTRSRWSRSPASRRRALPATSSRRRPRPMCPA
jgi:uncharacterized protein YbaP (TraB family)